MVGVLPAHVLRIDQRQDHGALQKWDEVRKVLANIGSLVLMPLVFAASTIGYLVLFFFCISCKLMPVPFLLVKFVKAGRAECTQEAFEVIFLLTTPFESSGELTIVLVDAGLSAQQDFRSNTALSTWALLSIVGSSLILTIEAWPYLYLIFF